MAIISPDNVTVGIYPLPSTAIRIAAAGVSGGKTFLNAIPAGIYELKPVIPPLPKFITDLISNLKISLPEVEPTYISPYQVFSLPVTAQISFPFEKITNVRVLGPLACMLESPLPVLKFPNIVRSLDQITRIGISPWWAPGLFFDPFVTWAPSPTNPPLLPAPLSVSKSGGVGNIQPDGYFTFTVNIGGYYTDRNWTDREYILKEKDVIAKYNINGKFTRNFPSGNFRERFPIKPESIKNFAVSDITPYTFFAANPFGGAAVEEVMIPKLRCADAILGFKPSEIRMMRFYFIIIIDSVIYPPVDLLSPSVPSIPVSTPYLCHMTVDSNNDWMSILRMLIANALIDGPCTKVDADGNKLTYGDTPVDEPNPSLEIVCYNTDEEFEKVNAELNDYLNNIVLENTKEYKE